MNQDNAEVMLRTVRQQVDALEARLIVTTGEAGEDPEIIAYRRGLVDASRIILQTLVIALGERESRDTHH